MKAKILLGCLSLTFATCAGRPAPTADETGQIAEARRCLSASDPDGALALTDQLLRRHDDLREVWCIAGEGNLMLSRLDRRGLDNQLVLRDAEHAFLRATELQDDGADAWFGLAQARFELGDFAAARTAALKAGTLRAQQHAAAEATAAATLLAARCDLRELAALRQQELQNGKPDERGTVPVEPDTLARAQRALGRFAQVEQSWPAEAFRGAAQVYQWVGQNDNALLELERGIRAAPEVAAVHTAYQDLHVAMGQQRALAGAYARFVRENPGQPILLWFQGRALVVTADSLRQKQSFQPAIDAYRHAAECYRSYAVKVPAYADSANQWLAICELSIARTAVDMGDIDSAKEHLFAAAKASPLATAYDGDKPRLVDSFGSHFAGVVFAIGRALGSDADRGALERTLAFHEQVIERFPGQWGFVYNNAALPARDLGVLLVRDLDGKTDEQRRAAMTEAMALWEKSYRWYEEAVRLSPDDPRIANDCGLMLIYHLNRDFDRARELFDRAIALGQAQLDALPKDAPADERNFLEEAVGDAYQNIAVLLSRHLQQPFAEQKPFLEKAVQYYPYRQREAARMLENDGRESAGNGLNPRSLRGGSGQSGSAPANPSTGPQPGGGAGPTQGDGSEKFDKARKEAEALAADGDLDGALAVLDRVAAGLRDFAPFQSLRGHLNLRYARQARDAGRKDVEFLFADAAAALQKAVELDSEPVPPRLLLAEAQYEQSDFTAAARTAKAALHHMQSQGGGAGEQIVAAHTVLANAAAREYLANVDQDGSKQLLDDARLAFRQLDKRSALDAGLQTTWATLEATAGAPAAAVAVYAHALERAPDDQALLAAMVDAASRAGEPKLAVDALAGRSDAAGLWYRGRARFLTAAGLRAGGKIDAAIAELDRATADFRKSMQQNADFTDSCQQWTAICLGKKGNAAIASKDWDHAEQWLLEAVRTRPDRIGDDLGLQETTKIGVMTLADHFRQDDLGKTEAIYRAATAAADSDLDLLNNAGLFARDHGVALERRGLHKQAIEMFEQSYRCYSRAVELDPSNVRLRNDRALIAIHHLDCDWDDNRQLLEQAIADGEQQLPRVPAGDVQARQDLDEAIGDCWENLALWHLEHDHDAAAAKAAAQQSVQHHPGQSRPGARRHLAAAEKQLQVQK